MDRPLSAPPRADLGQIEFFCVAFALALLVGLAEVAGGYHENAYPRRAAVNHRALRLYLLYLLLTFLLGEVLLEHGVVHPSRTAAVVLGILGPTLLKTQAKLFEPIAGDKNALNANVERIVQGMRQFSFAQINANLADRRFRVKRQLARPPRGTLLDALRTLYTNDEFQTLIQPLVDDYEARDPQRPSAPTAA